MFGKTYALVLVIEPVDLVLIIRELRIKISTEHFPPIISVFLHLSSEIKVCDVGGHRVNNIPCS
jgi:hypothetical protein